MKKISFALVFVLLSGSVQATTDTFAFNLYSKVTASGGNIAVSPAALRKVLAALAEGAKGETKSQLVRALGESGVEGPSESSSPVELYWANRIWIQQEYTVRKEYSKAVQKIGGVDVESAALLDDMALTAKNMGTWTREKTHKKIPQVIAEESVEEMVASSALAFEGIWKTNFNKLKPDEFTPSSGKKMKVAYMQKTADMPYVANDVWQAVELGYAGDAYSMWIFLPNNVKSLSKLEKNFTAESTEALMASAQAKTVQVTLPRFKARFGQNLALALNALGVKSVFAKGADLSGITGTKELFLHGLFHRVAMDVEEKGEGPAPEVASSSPAPGTPPPTDAAVQEATKPLIETFKANHSFLYLVRHNPSGQIVVMGRLVNP